MPLKHKLNSRDEQVLNVIVWTSATFSNSVGCWCADRRELKNMQQVHVAFSESFPTGEIVFANFMNRALGAC